MGDQLDYGVYTDGGVDGNESVDRRARKMCISPDEEDGVVEVGSSRILIFDTHFKYLKTHKFKIISGL